MDYDVVIATRNRAEALEISVPLILNQDQPPRRLIIVDASDDHEEVRQSVISAMANYRVDLKVLCSQPNLPAQRNIGLKHVSAPVVMFPDDDSLWWPGVAKAVMRVYERDKNGDIGGVCARETKKPPHGTNLASEGKYKMRTSDQIRKLIEGVRHKFDDRFCPDPVWVHGRSRWSVHPTPKWFADENAALVEYMGGFRMSFRTEIIHQFGGFDEDLGAYIGWAACEDADASFRVMQRYLVVGAHKAKVFHYKAPNRRADGYRLGFVTLFNRAYVISRHSLPGSPARRALMRFGTYKMILYMMAAYSKFGRGRVRGIFEALKQMKFLLNSSSDDLRSVYLQICEQILVKKAEV